MRESKSHFKFNKQERDGIFFLLLIILIFQGAYFFVNAQPHKGEPSLVLNTKAQSKLDSLKNRVQKDTLRIFPFNPNYITDLKGYTLGMSSTEIDRLLSYRKQHKYVNSAKEFQAVTKVSDSLLQQIEPYFKFPIWNNKTKRNYSGYSSAGKANDKHKKDLNKVSAEELTEVHGIGKVLSQRIVKFRNRLGGFLIDEQLYDVYGLEPEVVMRALKKFEVITKPDVNKVNLNKASVTQLSNLAYINRDLALLIIAHREKNGPFDSLDDLTQVEGFPSERIGRIKLYLQL